MWEVSSVLIDLTVKKKRKKTTTTTTKQKTKKQQKTTKNKQQHPTKFYLTMHVTRLEGYKTFLVFNRAEHKIYLANIHVKMSTIKIYQHDKYYF